MQAQHDSVFTPGARPADAGSRPRPQNGRPGNLVLRVERYELRPVLDAQGRPVPAPRKDAEGRPVLDADGQRVMAAQTEAVGVYGTASCSGEKVYMRLSTGEELKADGCAKGASANRHSINVIRLGAAEGIERGRRGEMADPAALPPDQRPFWRCDGAVPLCNARGERLMTQDGYLQMRCRWITAYCNYTDKAGRKVDMLSHVSSDQFATLSVSLRSDRDASPSAVNYYGLFADSVKAHAQQGGKRFADACREASVAIVKAWQAQAGQGRPEHFGRLSVTAWHPGFALRFNFGGPEERDCVQRLAAWLARPKFASVWKTDRQGIEREQASFCQPEFLVRLLNARGEVCGAARVRPWTMEYRRRELEAAGRAEDARSLATPGGKAAWLAALGREARLASGDAVCGADVLCGECSRVSQIFENTEAFGQPSANARNNTVQQTRNMLYLAFLHTQPVLPRKSRRNIGCSQVFVSRSEDGIVKDLYRTLDGSSYRNAVLLGPGGGLPPSPAFERELQEENRLRTDLSLALGQQAQERAEEAQGQAAGRTPRQEAGQSAGQTSGQAPEPSPAAAAPAQAQARAAGAVPDAPGTPARAEAGRQDGQKEGPGDARALPASPGAAPAPCSAAGGGDDGDRFRPGF